MTSLALQSHEPLPPKKLVLIRWINVAAFLKLSNTTAVLLFLKPWRKADFSLPEPLGGVKANLIRLFGPIRISSIRH